jgi:PleD family two-component response regulator
MPESTTTSINTVEEIITQLIETTGRMLHIAKSSGRNRVAVASTYVQQAP